MAPRTPLQQSLQETTLESGTSPNETTPPFSLGSGRGFADSFYPTESGGKIDDPLVDFAELDAFLKTGIPPKDNYGPPPGRSPPRPPHRSPPTPPPYRSPCTPPNAASTGQTPVLGSYQKKEPILSVEEVLEWKNRVKLGSSTKYLTGEEYLDRLGNRDHVFLIDDSKSMGPYWSEVTKTFGALSYLVKHVNLDGIDLHFTNSLETHHSRRTRHLLEKVQRRKPAGQCDMKSRLGKILEPYRAELPRALESSRHRHFMGIDLRHWSSKGRSICIYVFTDGVWQGGSRPLGGVDEPIRIFVNKLEELGLLDTQVGIQFIRFGNDKRGMERLQKLDSDLHLPIDIVDTTPWDGNVWKMLLGAIDQDWDDNEDYKDDGHHENQSITAFAPLSIGSLGAHSIISDISSHKAPSVPAVVLKAEPLHNQDFHDADSKSLRIFGGEPSVSPTVTANLTSLPVDLDFSGSESLIPPTIALTAPSSANRGVSNTKIGDTESPRSEAFIPSAIVLEKPPSPSFSDSDSDGSDVSAGVTSVFSIALTQSSKTSLGPSGMMYTAAEAFTDLLCADDVLSYLSRTAVQNNSIGKDRFSRNFHRLLQRYSFNLERESRLAEHRHAVQLVRRMSLYITNTFCHKLSAQTKSHDKFASLVDQRLKLDNLAKAELFVVDQRRIRQLLSQEEFSAQTELIDPTRPTTPLDPESESDDDGGSNIIIEEDLATEMHSLGLTELADITRFMTSSSAFQTLRNDLQDFVYPTFQTKLINLVNTFSKSVDTSKGITNYDLRTLVWDLQESQQESITISYDDQPDLLNYLKGVIEDFTRKEWEWWPLKPRKRNLIEGEARLKWQCSCGEHRWAEVPIKFAERVVDMSKGKQPSRKNAPFSIQRPRRPILERLYAQTFNIVKATPTNRNSHAVTSNAVTPNTHGSDNTNSNAGKSGTSNSSANITDTSNSQNHSDGSIEAKSYMRVQMHSDNHPTTLHIFLVVQSGDDHCLAQIKIGPGNTTDEFFQLLKSEYPRLRGKLRRWLSIWGYSHCEFFRFTKFRELELAPEALDYPGHERIEYAFKPRPIDPKQPISPHEFYARFYRCYRPRRLFHLLLNLFWPHTCRPPCNSRDALELFPKRKTPFEEGGDERELFWGIYARERPWFLPLLLYNILCTLPSIVFFFMWLFSWGHSGDLQNATIPFSISMSLLSLFWSFIYTNWQ